MNNNIKNKTKDRTKINKDKKKYIARIVFGIMVLITCLLIFIFSSDNGDKSTDKSMGTMKTIVSIFERDSSKLEETTKKYEPLLRKLAHFSIYTMLGIWSMSFISTFNIKNNSNKNEKEIDDFYKRLFIVILFGMLYACSDEFHQLFVSARSGSFRDVFIDTLGITNGALIVETLRKIYKYFKNIT